MSLNVDGVKAGVIPWLIPGHISIYVIDTRTLRHVYLETDTGTEL